MAVLWPPSEYIQCVYCLNLTFTTVLLSMVVWLKTHMYIHKDSQQRPKQVFSLGKLLIFC